MVADAFGGGGAACLVVGGKALRDRGWQTGDPEGKGGQ